VDSWAWGVVVSWALLILVLALGMFWAVGGGRGGG
jgi:hypothetical protein